jgi:hypothetical protein
MATTLMPAKAICTRCRSKYGVDAVIQTKNGSLPLLVVLAEVTTMKDALAGVICQLCLKNAGSENRGLYAVLTALGCAASGDAPVIAPSSRAQSTGPNMAGVYVEMPRRGPQGFVRREERLDDRPRLPRAFQPELREPLPAPEPFRAGLDERAKAALQAALPSARERDAGKQRRREHAFQAGMESLQERLVLIKSRAAKEDVEDLVVAFMKKLREVVKSDPLQRGKDDILEWLDSSQEELDQLRQGTSQAQVWRKKNGGGEGGDGGEVLVEHVLRAGKVAPPTVNDALGEPYAGPKIVYPKGKEYGWHFTIVRSSSESYRSRTWARAKATLLLWASEHEQTVLVCNGASVPLIDLLCAYLEPLVLPELVESGAEVLVTEGAVPSTPDLAPHHEA